MGSEDGLLRTLVTNPFIQLRGVSRAYQRGSHTVHALRDLDLDVASHTFTVVVGRSGSGKSTLLHALAAMEQPTTGSIRVGDWDVTGLDRRGRAQYRRKAVGMIFQRFNLVPAMSALENVALPLILAGASTSDRTRRATEALDNSTRNAGCRSVSTPHCEASLCQPPVLGASAGAPMGASGEVRGSVVGLGAGSGSDLSEEPAVRILSRSRWISCRS